MNKEEAISALHRIGATLRVKELPGGPVLVNIEGAVRRVVDDQEDLHDLLDQLTDAAQAYSEKQTAYFENCIANAFRIVDRRRKRFAPNPTPGPAEVSTYPKGS